LTGIFAASVMPVSLALIADLFPMEERQTAIGMFMGISFLGQGLSMAIGGSIAYFTSWRGVFILYTALSFLSTALLFTLGRHIPSTRNPDSRFFSPYLKLIGHRQSAWTYLVIILEGILIIGSFSYLGGFLEDQFKLNYLQIGLIMTAFGIMAVVGGRLSGKLAAKLGRRKVMLIGLASAAAANGLVGSLGSSLPVVVCSVALLGFGFMLAHSSLLTRATMFAMKARGTAMSLVAFCFMGGGGIGTAIGGRIIFETSYTSFFSLYGALLAVLLILASIVVRHDPHAETA
jgi:predicted MFS family arabinose efflux permease